MTEFGQLLRDAAGAPPRPLNMALVRERAARLGAVRRVRPWLLALIGVAGVGLPVGISLAPAGDRPGRVETVDGETERETSGVASDAPFSGPPVIAPLTDPRPVPGTRSEAGRAGPAATPAAPTQFDVAVAFASDRSGEWQIYVADAQLASMRAVTSGGGQKQRPALSPDGRWVAYVGVRTGTKSGIHTVATDGTGERTVPLDGELRDPSWAPDGRTLAVARRPPPPNPTEKSDNWQIWTVGSDGSNPRRIVSSKVVEFQPAWSPDGTSLAYVHFGTSGTASVWIVDAEGGSPVRVTPEGIHALYPAWSPDGSRLAFTGIEDDDGPSQIFTIRTDGSGLTRVTATDAWDDRPAWTADGNGLIFARDPDGYRVWGCLGGAGLNVGPGGQVEDDSGVVMNCIPGSAGPALTHLWAVEVDTRSARPLTSGSANELEPSTRRNRR